MAERREIQVVGLRQLSRGLRQLDAEFPKQLRLALNEAADIVVAEARSTVPRRTGALANSIRSASTRTAAGVKGGSKKVPYFGFIEFGGKVGRRDSVKRPFVREGRYLWPAIIDRREELADRIRRGIIQVAEQAGLDVS